MAMTEQDYIKAKQGLVMARINALNEIEAMLSFNLPAEDMQKEIKRILAEVKEVQQYIFANQPTPTDIAVQALTKAGYEVVGHTDACITVKDPYYGYNSGVYALDGFNVVNVMAENVSKFIEGRK